MSEEKRMPEKAKEIYELEYDRVQQVAKLLCEAFIESPQNFYAADDFPPFMTIDGRDIDMEKIAAILLWKLRL